MYSYQEALDSSKEYFNGDELAARVFVDKYALRDNEDNILEKTPTDMHWRLAKEFARIEKKKFKKPLSEEFIFGLFDRFKRIIPQGSPMYGIGNKYQYVSLGNCFVIPNPHDSYLGVLYTDTQITQISCRRGGVGWSISDLRPVGLPVKNAAKSTTGAISFAKRFSNTIREIAQFGRRAASLQALHVAHPEIIDFIKVKQNLTEVTGSNISVQFTDEFMNSVLNDEDFELKWPVNSDTPKITKIVKAKDIWKEFVHSAWLMAEPGAAYWDTIINRSTTAPYRKFGFLENSSNPCISEGSLVNTPYGYKKVEDIKIGDLISTVLGYEPVKTVEINENIPTFKVTFSDGGVQYVTESHLYHTIPSQKVKVLPKMVSELEIGDAVRVSRALLKESGTEEDYKNALKQGVLIGDGCYTKKTLETNNVSIACNSDEVEYIENIKVLFGKENVLKDKKNNDGSKSISIVIRNNSVKELIKNPCYSYEKFLEIEKYNNINKVIGVLDGILATDGNVNLKSNHAQVRWMTTSPRLAQDIRRLLLTIGCHGFISKNHDDSGTINGRKIVRRHSKYTITISGESVRAYCLYSKIASIHPEKGEKLKRSQIDFKLSGNCWTVKVKSIEPYTVGRVYDLYCEDSDSWITEGYVQFGCGEQYLPPYASCRLILLNLLTYVKDKFTDRAEFDYEAFAQDTKYMQRLCDDMVDLELECVDRIICKIESDPEPDEVKQIGIDLWENVKRCAINDRRTGCGFTALGDCVAALNLKFDSEESLEFIGKMSETFKVAAFTESVEMAKELGPFPIYDSTLDITSEFIQELRDEHPDLYKKMVKYGRRNMTLLTVAPAGSVSCLTQTTSGLEPAFMLEYTRRKKGNPGDKDFRVDFTDKTGDNWMEFVVRHKGLQDWMDITGKTDLIDSPYYKSTSHDIDWVEKVKMQSIIGRNIDNSLSVTVNLPADVTEEKVSEIYMTAWKLGCKGMTIYRDGCRSGVLISNEKKEDKPVITKTTAPERPKVLECDIHHLTVKGVKYFTIVGLLENEPYEIFINRNCNYDGETLISKSFTKGQLDKARKGQYNLIDENGEEIYQIVSTNCDEHEEALARMSSTALRHGADINFVVRELEKTRGDMQSFSKAMARTLKKYIKDGTEVKGEVCPNCESKLIRSSGCVECSSCGWSKC
jgi:ribonucleoside-diphosphate reductase alpha chain